jgi:hypothetical protein
LRYPCVRGLEKIKGGRRIMRLGVLAAILAFFLAICGVASANEYKWRDDFTAYEGWSEYDVVAWGSKSLWRKIESDPNALDGYALHIGVALSSDIATFTYRTITFPSPVDSIYVEFRERGSPAAPPGICSRMPGFVYVYSRPVNPAEDFHYPRPTNYDDFVRGIGYMYDLSYYTTTATLDLKKPTDAITLVLMTLDNSNICQYSSWWDYIQIIGHPATPPVIKATIDIDPNVLNVNSKSSKNAVTLYVELPDGYDVADINISTIKLNATKGSVQAQVEPAEIGDYDSDGSSDLMVKFDRQALIEIVDIGDQVELIATGQLNDGTPFQGSDTIRVISKEK